MAWRTAPIRWGATTCSTTAWPWWPCAKEKNDTVFQKTLGINDFYLGAKDYPWPIGNIQMIGKSNAEAMRGEKPKLTRLSPEWTLSDVAEHAVDFWLTTEDLPVPGNRVTTDKDGNVHLSLLGDQRRGA